MAGNIIPAIATTNAMTASLSVLQSFKVLRGDYSKARMQFLSKSTERLISAEPLRPPRFDCPICGVCQATIDIDFSRATVRDFVHGLLKDRLGYGDEVTVSTAEGIIFDPDLHENLEKLLSELGVKQDSFLTVVDDDDQEPRVNVVFAVSGEEIPVDQNAIHVPEIFVIPRKTKEAEQTVNGELGGMDREGDEIIQFTNGFGSGAKRKRSADAQPDLEADIVAKRGKVLEQAPVKVGNEVQMIDDIEDGAIVIDD